MEKVLNKISRRITQPKSQGASQAMLFATGLTEADMAQDFDTGSLAVADRMRLVDIVDAVKKIYCGTVGIEYYYITNTRKRRWLQARLAPVRGNWAAPFPAGAGRKVLHNLTRT